MTTFPLKPPPSAVGTRNQARRALRTAAGCVLTMMGTAIILGLALGQAVAVALAQEGTPTPVSSIGLTRADPAPLGAAVQAGPVELQVLDVLSGPDAIGAVLAASPTNVEPREGITYLAVNLSARNTGTQPLWLDNGDFALTGDSGLVWRFLGAQPPDPALDVTLQPGESAAGWVVFGIPTEERSLLLIFDCLELGGSWADRVLAIEDGAQIPISPSGRRSPMTPGPTSPPRSASANRR